MTKIKGITKNIQMWDVRSVDRVYPWVSDKEAGWDSSVDELHQHEWVHQDVNVDL